MKKKYIIIIMALAAVLLFTSCSTTDNSVDQSTFEAVENQLVTEQQKVNALEETIEGLEIEINDLETQVDTKTETIETLEIQLAEANETLSNNNQNSSTLLTEALTVLNMFATQDAQGLSTKASPTRGVRFSPYQYVDTNQHITFYPNNQIGSMFTNTTVYVWGEYDGTGDDIAGDFLSYYNEFVWDEDYLNPEIIGINTIVSSGNMINNIETVYATDEYVEFYFTGFDPQFNGMDWRSLTLVFEEDNGTYYLVGVVHGQWTI